MLALLQRPVRGTIAVSAIEHPAIKEQARMLECLGWKTLSIPANKEGIITAEAVLRTIHDDTAFVAVMAVNNETGAIQPVEEIATALRTKCAGKKKPHFHVDAVQAAGKIPLNLSFPGIDSGAVSAHKLRGPRGIGLLYLAHRIEPFIRGGGQESGFRPGTENVAGAVALSLCLEKAIASLGSPEAEDRMEYLMSSLTANKAITPIPESRAARDERFSPYVAQFTNAKIPGEVLVRALSDKGVYISTGSACSSKKRSRPVLEAMHVSADKQQNAFRISLGPLTTNADIDALAKALEEVLSGL
jgi:cysteine desulfurase